MRLCVYILFHNTVFITDFHTGYLASTLMSVLRLGKIPDTGTAGCRWVPLRGTNPGLSLLAPAQSVVTPGICCQILSGTWLCMRHFDSIHYCTDSIARLLPH